MKKRHFTPDEIKAQMNMLAREKRMADRSPWTAMGIVCGYTLMTSEGFKGRRIADVCQKIDEYEALWREDKLDVETVSRQLMKKADWSIEFKEYTDADIRYKKGSYGYVLDKIQIEPQNRINEMATRYLLFFFKALNEVHGYGKERLTRVQEHMNKVLDEYRTDKDALSRWKVALYNDAGIYFENPIDPLTQTSGSVMCG